jgi:putative oxidoreductase
MENTAAFHTPGSWQPAAQRAGRALLGLLFVVSGVMKIGRFAALAGVLGAKGIPLPEVAIAIVIALEIVAGAALVVDRTARPAAAALAIFVVAATLLFHAFWAADAATYMNQFNHFFKNVAILGALIALCASPSRR